MKKKETKKNSNLLLIGLIVSCFIVDLCGLYIKHTGLVHVETYEPGVVYSCLYVKQLRLEEELGDYAQLAAGLAWKEAKPYVKEAYTQIFGAKPEWQEEDVSIEKAALVTEKAENAEETEEMDGTEEIDGIEETEVVANSTVEDTKKTFVATKPVQINGTVLTGKNSQTKSYIPVDPMTLLGRFETVDDSYFEDALFIGDSRVVGLETYTEIPDSSFAALVGLNVYQLMDRRFIKIEETGDKWTIRELLEKNQYKKIYLMVGINDLGISNAENFEKQFRDIIDEIIRLQPNAVIFIQSVLHVTENKSRTEKNINNPKINIRNEALRNMADNKRIFYLDINSLYDDENGNLQKGLSGDGVHLKAKYYEAWKDYLYTHGIVK